jgi:DNA processing protein
VTPDARIRAWVALSSVPGLGPHELHPLLKALGSPEGLVEASLSTLAKHVPVPVAESIKGSATNPHVGAILDWAAADPANHLLVWDDPDYPRTLFDIGDSPILLYYKGRRELLGRPALGVVGSRNATPVGLQTAEDFAEALASAGLTIVSGLALGIDAAAHRGALRAGTTGGSTIAIVGTGIDRIYPARNEALAHRIASEGGILTEFPLGTPALRQNFPQRNRLISGLTRGVLVVEAALGSGSLITARCAGEQGREVFAIPGSIHSPMSRGCHKLIREGAKLVETARDVLDELGMPGTIEPPTPPTTKESAKESGPRARVLSALGYDPATPDELVARLAWPVERVMTHLLELEMSGKIARMQTGRFQRLQ